MNMSAESNDLPPINVLIVAQAGRLQYEAVLFAASLQASGTSDRFQLYVAEPRQGPRWYNTPSIQGQDTRDALIRLGAKIIQFDSHHFGSNYPFGNKIEALHALPKGEPFIFFDTDTMILDALDKVPFNFERPTASMKRENTWPNIELYGPGYTETWKSLYDKFGLDFDSSLDLNWPDEYWQRYLYFNAGYFFYKCPHEFGDLFLRYATRIQNDPLEELVCQSLDPWLDQVALPLVIHALGGGRGTIPDGLLDGSISCHYRVLSLLYARESDEIVAKLEELTAPNWIKKVLKSHEPFKRLVFQGRGQKLRALIDRDNLPRREQGLRNLIKREGFWMR